MTGARQLATLLPEMERQGQELGVVSMCIGTGMGDGELNCEGVSGKGEK